MDRFGRAGVAPVGDSLHTSVVTAATAWPSSTRPLRLALATLLGACVLLLSLIELALSTAGTADPL